MEKYKNIGGRSGIISYEISDGSIKVLFNHGGTYLYTNASAGRHNIEKMISLATAGKGLNGFINSTVKKRYASKLK